MFTEEILVPVRFLTSVGQLLGTLAVFLERQPHILVALAPDFTPQEYDVADDEFFWLLAVSISGLVVELGCLLSGLSFFGDSSNSLHCFLHLVGCLAVATFAISGAHFAFFWHIFWISIVLPLLVESGSLYSIFCLRKAAFS